MSDVAHGGASGSPPAQDNSWRQRYWKKNLRLLVGLLVVWAIVSFGFGVLLIEPLNNIEILGFPLGLWFAQQGSIYTFVIIILVYALRMDYIDKEFGVDEKSQGGDQA